MIYSVRSPQIANQAQLFAELSTLTGTLVSMKLRREGLLLMNGPSLSREFDTPLLLDARGFLTQTNRSWVAWEEVPLNDSKSLRCEPFASGP